jgi:hypothetical protein
VVVVLDKHHILMGGNGIKLMELLEVIQQLVMVLGH